MSAVWIVEGLRVAVVALELESVAVVMLNRRAAAAEVVVKGIVVDVVVL